ncbi:hypothetical protein MLD38_012363 [Melastoma candidum]|uniref:Uncharacterized protein n=1 Tax=Melastoma candidum TaxID=119954 RepID=A0ACB9RA88_9MYRT|nr:hypothetical protein MLD38_012363 [Melastoma candidum]
MLEVEMMSELTRIIVKEASDKNASSDPRDGGIMVGFQEEMILSRRTSMSLVPFIGQRFVSQDAAYELYCGFAKQCGFSIRRHRTRGKDGVGRGVTRRDFACHRGGYPQTKPSDDGKQQRDRRSSRCGCQAFMRIVKRADFDVPEWRVTGFSNVHNHELLKSSEVEQMPAYSSNMSADDKSRICMYAKAGMSVRQMLRLMELEKGVKLGCLPFTELDVRNLLQSFRNVDRDNDSINLLKMCKDKKDKDPDFKYDFQLHANNKLEHIAWSYASSRQSYEAYGDVVVFDTSHRLEPYDMIFGIWVGVDNHGTNCFFGCVLLWDENVQSFSWALKTFLDFMDGKAPQTILTEQNVWLKEAVASQMPRTNHAFCIWHIISKFSDWFSMLLGPRYETWKDEFLRLYNLRSAEDFEEGWREMVNSYGLHSNKHINSLYALCNFWALPYLRSFFFAGIDGTSESESTVAYIRRISTAQSNPDNLVEQVAAIVESKDEMGSKQKMLRKVRKIALKTGSPIESHAASVLTPYAFNRLQEELVLAPQYASLMVDEGYFIVRHHTELDGGCKVLWIPHEEVISCSCRHFEFSGILCRHILRVLSSNNCFQIPDQFLPLRWHNIPLSSPRSAQTSADHRRKIQLLHSMVETLLTESVGSGDRIDMACAQIATVLSRIKEFSGSVEGSSEAGLNSPESLMLPPISESDGMIGGFTTGEPLESPVKTKDRRPRDCMDMYRKRRRCLVPCCGQLGHDTAECPMMQGDDLSGDGLGFL